MFIVTVSLLLIAAIFVLADYFSVFGTRKVEKLDFVELNFRMIDEKRGTPVINVHVRCFQMHNNNACTQRDAHKIGYVRVAIPVVKIFDKTMLFNKGYTIQKTSDPKVHIMFIHNQYANPVETFLIPDLEKIKDQVFTVAMPQPVFQK